jgi:hypothetical protein
MDNLLMDYPSVLVVLIHMHFVTMNMIATGWSIV